MLKEINTITSLELVDLINEYRKEEGVDKVLSHKNLMKKVRNEFEPVINAGFGNGLQMEPVKYIDKKGEQRDAYRLGFKEAMCMLLRESKLVRFRVAKHLEELNRDLTLDTIQDMSNKLDSFSEAFEMFNIERNNLRQEIKQLELSLRAADRSNYEKIDRLHCEIEKKKCKPILC